MYMYIHSITFIGLFKKIGKYSCNNHRELQKSEVVSYVL